MLYRLFQCYCRGVEIVKFSTYSRRDVEDKSSGLKVTTNTKLQVVQGQVNDHNGLVQRKFYLSERIN